MPGAALVLSVLFGIFSAACGDGGAAPPDDVGAPTETGSGGESASAASTGGSMSGQGGALAGAAGTGGSAQGRGGSAGQGGAMASAGGGGASGVAGSGGSAGGGGGKGGATSCPTLPAYGAGTKGTPGVWEDVTPKEADIASTANGAEQVLIDPARPSDVYVGVNGHGVWKSTDYGTSWKKANTGTNGDKIDTGGFPYAAIELDPCRDQATAPGIYVTQLFGAGGIWKSTDGGSSWIDVWDKNIFGADGVTNISTDVGGDVHSIHMVVPSDKNHLIVSLHGYSGTGGNNGVFESTDGGGKWIVHKSSTFSFQPHNDVLFPIDRATWMVTPGTVSSRLNMFRTTDSAATWKDLGEAPARAIGRSFAHAGSVVYAGTDYNSNAFKSTDGGVTWSKLENSGGQISWVVTTATKVYASGGYTDDATIRHAELTDDKVWTVDRPGTGMPANANGHDAKSTFDGARYVIIAAQHKGGIWRYVEP
jgi:hypothetical protein